MYRTFQFFSSAFSRLHCTVFQYVSCYLLSYLYFEIKPGLNPFRKLFHNSFYLSLRYLFAEITNFLPSSIVRKQVFLLLSLLLNKCNVLKFRKKFLYHTNNKRLPNNQFHHKSQKP